MSNKILNTLSKTLPDDRPITGIQIIENLEKCPVGFIPINKTYDQDQDADLWREGAFLKRKAARYLCISKTEGLSGLVVQEIILINDKNLPPVGYSIVNRTADTDQKAWRKKQICYRLVNKKFTKTAITDIIVCSRLKKAPEGFTLAGEINGVIICYKMGNVQDSQADEANSQNGRSYAPPRPAPPPPTRNPAAYPSLEGDHDYEILNPPGPGFPNRPAPPRPFPVIHHQHSIHTLTPGFSGLEGVPFIINPKFMMSSNTDGLKLPTIKAKSLQQLEKEYKYDFVVERQT